MILLYMLVEIQVGDPNFLLVMYLFLLQLKNKLQVLTLGIGGVGVLSAYFSYSPEIAARYRSYCIYTFQKLIYNCVSQYIMAYNYIITMIYG